MRHVVSTLDAAVAKAEDLPTHPGRGDYLTVDPIEAREVLEGPTPLIAAMRAYVASKFGDEVDLP